MRSSFKMYGNFANISILLPTKSIDVFHSKISFTRMHSSRMRAGRSLTVCRGGLPVQRGVSLSRGGSPCPEGGLPVQRGVSLPGGGSPCRGGGLSLPRGVLLAGGGVLSAGGWDSPCPGGFSLPWGDSPCLGGFSLPETPL